MALRKIVTEQDPILRKTSRQVERFNDRLFELLDDMKETMYHSGGVGLAAVQVGFLRRVVVLDVGDGFLELINPEIVETSGENTDDEGCLSLPGKSAKITRPDYVKVRAQNRKGQWRFYEGTGLKARCFCHEIDHLDGVLYPDRMSGEEKLRQIEQQGSDDK